MIPKLNTYKERYQIESADVILPGLQAIEAAMELLQNPQFSVPVIHVAGTNGKGSTITFIESILRAHGLRTLTFMSPCIENVDDQIRLNNVPLQEGQMNTVFQQLQAAGISGKLTDFELLTAAAFVACREFAPDIAIIESGLGGRFDSTNVVQPIVSVVPSVALEHTNFLGDTITQIAAHKAGIIKKETPIIVGALDQEVLQVFMQESKQLCAPLFIEGKHFTINDEETFISSHIEIESLARKMVGLHQRRNLALAIEVSTFVLKNNLSASKVQLGARQAQLAGRFEQLAPNVFIDGAHNPASAKMLKETLQHHFPNESIHFIVGILKDKDVQAVLAELAQVGTDFTFVEVTSERERMMPAVALQQFTTKPSTIATNILQTVEEKMKQPGIVVMTGSLYLLAQWRTQLFERFV